MTVFLGFYEPSDDSPWFLWPYIAPVCRCMWWHHGRANFHGDTPLHTFLWKHMWRHIPPQRHTLPWVLSMATSNIICISALSIMVPLVFEVSVPLSISIHRFLKYPLLFILLVSVPPPPLWSPQLIYGPLCRNNTSSVEAQN